MAQQLPDVLLRLLHVSPDLVQVFRKYVVVVLALEDLILQRHELFPKTLLKPLLVFIERVDPEADFVELLVGI